jgi:hypothetical protein
LEKRGEPCVAGGCAGQESSKPWKLDVSGGSAAPKDRSFQEASPYRLKPDLSGGANSPSEPMTDIFQTLETKTPFFQTLEKRGGV